VGWAVLSLLSPPSKGTPVTGTTQASDIRFVVQRGSSELDADLFTVHGLESSDLIAAAAAAADIETTIDDAVTAAVAAISSGLVITSKVNNFTVATADAGTHYSVNKASGVTATIPTNGSDPIPIGTAYDGHAHGAGMVTFAGEDGTVTIDSADNLLSTRVQFSSFQLLKIGTNEWLLTGDLA
jgi:hypothetical protein